MLNTLRKALGALVAVAFLVALSLPRDATTEILVAAVVIISGGFALFSVFAQRPARSLSSHVMHPDPWSLLGSTVLLSGFGLLFASPAFGDAPVVRGVFGLASVGFAVYALWEMYKQRFGDHAFDHLSEALILAATLTMASWAVIIEPILHGAQHSVALGTPAAIAAGTALAVGCTAFRLATSFDRNQPAFGLMATGFAVPAVASLFSFAGDYLEWAYMNQVALALMPVSAGLVAAGAADKSMSLYEEPAGPAGARLNRLRLANLIVPVVIGPILLTLAVRQMVPLSVGAISMFSVMLSLLVVVHLIGMVQARASSTHWASHDKLTGLPNRALFRERAAQALDRSRKLDGSVAVMYLDLDRFKNINDSMGHEAGDQLLEQVAKRVLSCVDAGDTVARLGGDEFAILLPYVEGEDVPAKLSRRLLRKFSEPFQLKPRPVFMSPSIGIAVSENSTSLETLLTQADTAMYRAKESGRNNYAIWSQEMNEASKQRLLLETHLHSAIANDELRLLYQPKVELATGRVVGVEALIRWHHPSLGVISPSVFIHLAEESGLINQIGEWVLQTACQQGRAWYESGFRDLTVAVNLSSRQFQQQSVADLVSRVLRTTQLPPQLLELELTESVAMSGDHATLSTLNDLRDMGVRCTIDDFGTGYSNLSYLSRFPIDALKIDKSFVAQIDKTGDKAIVVAIIAMAHGLGLEVVAEGVETIEQAEFLSSQNCDLMQGFLFARPLPPNEIDSLMMLENVANGPGRLGISSYTPPALRHERRLEREQPDSERLPDETNEDAPVGSTSGGESGNDGWPFA